MERTLRRLGRAGVMAIASMALTACYGEAPAGDSSTAEPAEAPALEWEGEPDEPVFDDTPAPGGWEAPDDADDQRIDAPDGPDPANPDPADPDPDPADPDPADPDPADPAPGDDGFVIPGCTPEGKVQLRAWTIGVFETHCASCHQPDADNYISTGIVDVLELEELVASGMIVPGLPEASPPVIRMVSGAMPPPAIPDRPTDEDIAIVSQWVTCLAADDPVEPDGFVTHEQMFEWMVGDLSTFQLNERKFIRYLSLAHLFDAGASEEDLETYRHALSKLINSLSWNAKITAVVPVDTRGLVLRLDLRDYGWDDLAVPLDGVEGTDVWELIEAAYPYAMVFDESSQAEFLVSYTDSLVPWVQADWFASHASQPPLYHDILGLPDTLSELEALVGVGVQDDIELGDVARAGFTFSGVSVNNRVISRHELGLSVDSGLLGDYTGSYWVSYDFADNQGLKNIFQHPVDFVSDGSEVIFSLPNGFQGYYIADAVGQRLDSAPTNIVADPWSFPPDVVNGLSCMSCHYQGMQPALDEIRDIVLGYQEQYPQDVIGDVVKLYPPDDQLQALLGEDADRFAAALSHAGVPEAESRSDEPITALALVYDKVMTLAEVAARVGLTEEAFLAAEGIERLEGARAEIANLVDKGGALKREIFDESFQDIACFLDIADPVSAETGEAGCAIARLCNIGTGLPGDATLEIGGVELQALEGKCSPCRAVTVGETTEAKLTVVDVQQELDGASGQVVNVAEVVFSKDEILDLDDDDEYLLTLVPSGGGLKLVQDTILLPATCDDVP